MLVKNSLLLLFLSIFFMQSVLAEDTLNSQLPDEYYLGGTAGAYPSYQNGVLTIPRIDSDEQIGLIQDAQFYFDEQSGMWNLSTFELKPATDDQVPNIDNIETIITDSFPTQVFLRITGSFSSGCRFGQINQRLNSQLFEITVHGNNSYYDSESGNVCIWDNNVVQFSFEKNIPLSVYGLKAGTYQYTVNNGQYTGSFVLEKDNLF